MSACESCGDKTYRELLDDNVRVRAERDEARAEVERLRFELRKLDAYSAGPTWLTHQESIAAAYQRGAEAMREAAAGRIDAEGINGCTGPYFGNIIRALPIPKEEP